MKDLIETITGERILKDLNINNHELFQLVDKGIIKAYEFYIDPYFEQKGFPKDLAQAIQKLEIQMGEIPGKADFVNSAGRAFKEPYIVDPEKVKNLIFKMSIFEDLKKAYGLRNAKEKSKDLTEKSKYSFCRTGDIWEILYEGEKTSLKNIDGICYIARLLEKPNTYFYPSNLRRLVKGDSPEKNEDYSGMNSEQLEKEGVSLGELHFEDYSKEEIKKLETQVHRLWEDLNKAKQSGDSNKIEAKKMDWEKTKTFLSNIFGIITFESKGELKFKKLQRLNQDEEKQRINIAQRINLAEKKIENEISSLAKHLRIHIKQGNEFCYEINDDKVPDWYIVF